MGRGHRSRVVSNKEKAADKDQENALVVIKNQEFIAMRAAATAWPALSSKEEELQGWPIKA
jgi:hypothetical protein